MPIVWLLYLNIPPLVCKLSKLSSKFVKLNNVVAYSKFRGRQEYCFKQIYKVNRAVIVTLLVILFLALSDAVIQIHAKIFSELNYN